MQKYSVIPMKSWGSLPEGHHTTHLSIYTPYPSCQNILSIYTPTKSSHSLSQPPLGEIPNWKANKCDLIFTFYQLTHLVNPPIHPLNLHTLLINPNSQRTLLTHPLDQPPLGEIPNWKANKCDLIFTERRLALKPLPVCAKVCTRISVYPPLLTPLHHPLSPPSDLAPARVRQGTYSHIREGGISYITPTTSMLPDVHISHTPMTSPPPSTSDLAPARVRLGKERRNHSKQTASADCCDGSYNDEKGTTR